MKKEAKKSKTSIFIVVSIVLVLAIAVSSIIYFEKKTAVDDYDVVATVNGYQVYAKELLQQMTAEKPYVIDEYSDYTVDDEFWNTEIDGRRPIDVLRDRAFEKIVRYKVEQNIAVKNGVMKKEDTDYKVILQNLEKENIERSQKIANNQPIHGPQQYNETNYFNYIYSNMQIDNRDALGKEGNDLYANKKILKKWYESVKQEKYPKADTYKIINYHIYYKGHESNMGYTQLQAGRIMEKVKSALLQGKDLEYINKNICKDVVTTEMNVNDDNISDVQKLTPITFEVIPTLNKGDISEVVSENNMCSVYACITRKPGGYKEFSEHQTAMYSEYLDEKYVIYIDKKVKQAKIEKNDKFKYVGID